MRAPRVFRVAVLFIVLCFGWSIGGNADSLVGKRQVAQVTLAGKAGAGGMPTILVVRYKVLVAPPQEISIVQIALVASELRIRGDVLSKAQQDLVNKNSIGNIAHFPPARPDATGEVRLPIPQTAQNKIERYFVLFRMLPAHPGVELDKSLLQITSVEIE